MAGVFSAKLVASGGLGTGPVTIFTAPAGKVTVVRSVTIIQTSGGVTFAALLTAASVRMMAVSPPALFVGTPIDVRIVLDAGDVINFGAAGGTWDCYISGYLLDL